VGAFYLQEVKIMRCNRIRSIANILLIPLLSSLLLVNNIWPDEESTALERYVRLQGNSFIVRGISFDEIGPSAKKDPEDLWPFDKKEARAKYRNIANEIMGTLFRSAKDPLSVPLDVYLGVYLINDGDSIAALIRVRIVKTLRFVDESESGGIKHMAIISIVFWERSYLYIDQDYVSDQEDSKYTFREAIDKYFKEYLYEYIRKLYIA
jgi:hypothetical protein